jgi:hypothetical protein
MWVKPSNLQINQCSSGYQGALVRKALSHCVQDSKLFEAIKQRRWALCDLEFQAS